MAGGVVPGPIWGRRFKFVSDDPRVHLADPHYSHSTGAFHGGYSTCVGRLELIRAWPWVPRDTPLTCFECIQRELETQHMWSS